MSWAEIAQSEAARGKGGSVNNMRLASGSDYNVRFVGEPLKFSKYFINNKSAITDGGDACIIRNKFNIEPNTRYAVHVIDRADATPTLKIVEVAPSVLKPVIAWWKARKHDPGGASGCDFNIDVTGQKKMTRYTVTPLDITPFTEAELALIAKETGGVEKCLDRLKRLYKPVPQNEIEARLFGGNAPQGGAPTQQQEPVAAAAAGGGKPTGWSEPPF